MDLLLHLSQALSRETGLDPMVVAGGLSALAALLLGLMVALVVGAVRRARRRREEETEAARLAAETANARMTELARVQAETAKQIWSMGQMLHAQHAELQKTVHTRLDAVSDRLGQSMQHTTKQTTDNLQKLNERLAVIDAAQQNITELATQVTSLQAVLTNKQQRGAFGQGRM
jgi:DNA recombination protein RmuC